jgi:hypothetical protein
MFESIKRWFRGEASSEEERAAGGEPVATPPPGAASSELDDADRETSTNAQMEGAVGQPWPDEN